MSSFKRPSKQTGTQKVYQSLILTAQLLITLNLHLSSTYLLLHCMLPIYLPANKRSKPNVPKSDINTEVMTKFSGIVDRPDKTNEQTKRRQLTTL